MAKTVHIICLTILFLSFSTQRATGQNLVVVDKSNLRLVVVGRQWGDTLLSCPVALGANFGQKRGEGDRRTPEGIFPIAGVENAARWTHDFGDGHGPRQGAYGQWFVRLDVEGFTGIGLHGTCFPESVGTFSSEGCVRLLEADLRTLVTLIGKGDLVVILPEG